jgi:glycosyltransferase involved in cell wall biosynthesis
MKFSVLLPTRNRLELLRYAVESVRRQDYDNWEIILSDNFSDQDIQGYAESLGDARVRYFRTDRFIHVTDNWNNALDKATGDYVIMLGDDDCLMKGYFRRIANLISEFSEPDGIYTNAFLFAYPGVMPESPGGFLQPYGYAPFFTGRNAPFLLDRSKARELVGESLNFRMKFTYNMQHSAIRMAFIRSLSPKGPFFQSPYPDFYATNVMFLKAMRLLICPTPLVTIGISPKSFGYYYFNRQESQGVDFLNNLPDKETLARLECILLPGQPDKTSWLVAMERIRDNYRGDLPCPVNYRRYRFLQILYVYGRHSQYRRSPSSGSKEDIEDYEELWKRMKALEKILIGYPLKAVYVVIDRIPEKLREIVSRMAIRTMGFLPFQSTKIEGRYATILDVYDDVDPDQDPFLSNFQNRKMA